MIPGETRWRLAQGVVIDRSRPLAFRFNGRVYYGCHGDTLASALLANGCRLVARSFKYHRPRGLVAIGEAEPNALVRLGEGETALANQRATEIPLFEGLVARSQNCWPSVGFDIGAGKDRDHTGRRAGRVSIDSADAGVRVG